MEKIIMNSLSSKRRNCKLLTRKDFLFLSHINPRQLLSKKRQKIIGNRHSINFLIRKKGFFRIKVLVAMLQ